MSQRKEKYLRRTLEQYDGIARDVDHLNNRVPTIARDLEQVRDRQASMARQRTADMTRIYADTLHIERAGTAENPVEFIVINLPDGFRYTGDNLRLAFRTEAKTYARTYFVTDDNAKGTYYRSNDNPEKMATANWTMESSPVMYLEATGSQLLTGTVTDHTGSPLQGVAVTMKHDNVRYAATTDTEGRYSITVAQTALAYQTSFELEGYKTVTREVRFGSGDGPMFSKVCRKR